MVFRLTVIISTSLILLAYGCLKQKPGQTVETSESGTVQITGNLEGGVGQRVLLEEMGAREFIPVDTVVCNASGSFKISFVAAEVAFYVLRYGENKRITLLIEPGEQVELSGSMEESGSYTVQGSIGSKLLHQLSEQHQWTLAALGEITRKNMELVSDPEYATLKSELDRKFDSITSAFHEYSVQFIKTHSESLAILVALYNLYGQGLPVFHPSDDMDVYRYVDSALYSQYSGIEAVDLLHAQITEASLSLGQDEHLQSLQQGEIAPDFVSSRPDGSQLALSDLKGNYVLVSFWAGWSALSREENAFLKKAFQTYSGHRFKILQVSLDDSLEDWAGAIDADGLEWDQVSDLQRWDSPVADLYRVEKIPSNVLVDPFGRVVDRDLLGERLLVILESIFNP
jgi:peroxiredoxin